MCCEIAIQAKEKTQIKNDLKRYLRSANKEIDFNE